MADLIKVIEVGKKVAPVLGGIVAGMAIGIAKGVEKGFKKGYEKASRNYKVKYIELVNKFEEYKRKQK